MRALLTDLKGAQEPIAKDDVPNALAEARAMLVKYNIDVKNKQKRLKKWHAELVDSTHKTQADIAYLEDKCKLLERCLGELAKSKDTKENKLTWLWQQCRQTAMSETENVLRMVE